MNTDPDYLAHLAAYRKAGQEAKPLLRIVRDGETVRRPSPAAMAAAQVEEAIQRGKLDFSVFPRFAWPSLAELLGPLMPGSVVVLGAGTAQGKTSFLLTEMDDLQRQGRGTLYVPLETEPRDCRRRWAAWSLGYDWEAVNENRWSDLPPGAEDRIGETMIEQARDARVQFVPERTLNIGDLTDWVRWGIEEAGTQCVVIDHLHQLDVAGFRTYREAVIAFMRQLKALAQEYEVPILIASQITQSLDPFDRYLPPSLDRLRESAAIKENADIVLMLSRRMRHDVEMAPATLKALYQAGKCERDLADPDTMVVTCRKHRVRDSKAADRSVLLRVTPSGRVEERYGPVSPAYRWGAE